ncbi:hypothetical protein DP939_40990 [Spongiactinospora rosea]|uniref:Uncharacterized protein n=1 Tax=Spongiactinospora rosea TaxID=2248750 RepID=A0A366LLN1_9ACTN|nr:hypothetical protein DP939_40990 [Spongiactinospora rosea]
MTGPPRSRGAQRAPRMGVSEAAALPAGSGSQVGGEFGGGGEAVGGEVEGGDLSEEGGGGLAAAGAEVEFGEVRQQLSLLRRLIPRRAPLK